MAKVVNTQWYSIGDAYLHAQVDGLAYPECPFAKSEDISKTILDVQCNHPVMWACAHHDRWCAILNNHNECPFGRD